MAERVVRAAHLLLDDGWASPGYLAIGADGTIAGAGREPLPGVAETLDGFVLAGLPNVHSHAHHRGLVGHADVLSGAHAQTLWSWRERMYDHLLGLAPEQLEAQAAQAYVEMLKRGFTTVGEFHYIHNAPDGSRYAEIGELSWRIVRAARRVGIGLTLLPALYTSSGPGQPALPEQRRFVLDVDAYLDLVERMRRGTAGDPLVGVGIAPHSLRAVGPDELRALLDVVVEGPIHIHVSERVEEVEQIELALGRRPVAWLAEHVELDSRWTLIHATHTTSAELAAMARSGAVVGLCPLTEANLADGLFGLGEYHHRGGRWAVGSDANHLIDGAGELRTLEYGQRVVQRRRDMLLGAGDRSVASVMVDAVSRGGAQALAQPIGALRAGLRADLVELDPGHPALVGQTPQTALDAWVFSSADGRIVRNVMVGGRWVVRDGRHAEEETILRDFERVMRERHG